MTALDASAPLPRGRHTLTRGQVEESQRIRLAVAMAEACAESGYADTPVRAVLERAGVSRLTFYELYDGKLDCFLDALDLVGAVLVSRLGDALEEPGGSAEASPVERAGVAIERYLDAITENLAFARLYIVEVHAAGVDALVRRAELQAQLVDALVELFGATEPDRRFSCEAYVAAVSALVTLPVVTSDVAALRALREPLIALLRQLEG